MPFTDTKGYIALTAFVINVIVAVLLTFLFRGLKIAEGIDETRRPTTTRTPATGRRGGAGRRAGHRSYHPVTSAV